MSSFTKGCEECGGGVEMDDQICPKCGFDFTLHPRISPKCPYCEKELHLRDFFVYELDKKVFFMKMKLKNTPKKIIIFFKF